MIPLAISLVLCGVLYHFLRHSLSTMGLVATCLVPPAFAFFLGFFGILIGAAFTGAMLKVNL